MREGGRTCCDLRRGSRRAVHVRVRPWPCARAPPSRLTRVTSPRLPSPRVLNPCAPDSGRPDLRASQRSRRRGVLAGALAFLAGVAALGGFATPAAAHDELVSTSPTDGTTVSTAPAEVLLVFSEPPVALGSEVQVLGPDGANLSVGDLVLDGSTVHQPLRDERPQGAYRVQWRVTSDDGHTVTGEFSFTATAGAGGPTATPAPASSVAPTSTTTPSPEPAPSATLEPATPGGTDDGGGVSGLTVLLAGGGLVVALAGAALVIGGIRRLRAGSTD